MRANALLVETIRHCTRAHPIRRLCARTGYWPQYHRSYHRSDHQRPPTFLGFHSFTTATSNGSSSNTGNGTAGHGASSSTSFSSPTRPDIFYHLVDPSSDRHPVFAISFLSTPPPSPDSCTIIGWLPASSSASAEFVSGREPPLSDFVENRKFRGVLHEAIKAGLVESVDDLQTSRAVQTHNGWMHINDDRNVPALGRINNPDDIIASVLVEDGKILPDTYQPMPTYRFCTTDGLPQLTPGLTQKLKTVLEQRTCEEQQDGIKATAPRSN